MRNKLSQQGQVIECDVLVIGTGLAGLHYCLQLLATLPTAKIALISKAQVIESNSRYAQGGIAAACSTEDSLQSHISDTLIAGDGLCYQPAVEFIIRQGPQVIEQLKQYLVPFKRNAKGQFHLAIEGGHTHRRIFNCGDQTGLLLIQNLYALIMQHPQIQVFEQHIAVNLITQYHPHRTDTQGEVLGAYILDCQSGKIHTFVAQSVILATGGAGKTYRYTTNPDVATGDGVAMAYRAGARVGNMEFYQFHPTLLYHPECRNFLISEAVRGEGAFLRLVDTGERFMQHYAPEQQELATRDVVARAMFTEIECSSYNYVYLDITHRPRSFLEKRFPNIYKTLLSLGIDICQDMIPVVPGAHYLCGGVLSNLCGRTDKQRLYCIGEVAFTGLHGANRLASNSLLEAGVTAQQAAHDCIAWLDQAVVQQKPPADWNSQGVTDLRRASQVNAHWRGLRGEMTSYAGIVRTEAGLKDLLELIITRRQMIEEYYRSHVVTQDLLELRNIILVAELIVRSALQRRESRGGHYREDYPTKSERGEPSLYFLE